MLSLFLHTLLLSLTRLLAACIIGHAFTRLTAVACLTLPLRSRGKEEKRPRCFRDPPEEHEVVDANGSGASDRHAEFQPGSWRRELPGLPRPGRLCQR